MDALPPDVRTELVMAAAALDGHGVTTHRFRSAEPLDALLARVRDRWRADGRPIVESRTGAWRLLSVRGAEGFTTLQARASVDGSEGMVSRWRAAPDAAELVPFTEGRVLDRWLPDGSEVLRRVAHRDPGRDAATLVAHVPSSPEQAARTLRTRAANEGFVDDPALGAPANRAAWFRGGSGAGEALAFRRGREEVVATVSSHRDGAAVVLHWGQAR
jgi:hypothetical protein